MNKKQLNIVLLLGVVGIWGIVIYKLFGGIFTTKQSAVMNEYNMPITEFDFGHQKDTFLLAGFNRDPFLGKKIKSRNSNSNHFVKKDNKSSYRKKVNNHSIDKPWPKIEYLGFVKEKEGKDPLLLLKVNDRLFRKKASVFEFDNVRVINFYKDSIELKRGREYKIIYK